MTGRLFVSSSLARRAIAGGGKQRSVDLGAIVHRDTLALQVSSDGVEKRTLQPSQNQFVAAADEGDALGRRLMGGETAEPGEAGAVVKCLAQPHVREVVPSRQQRERNSGSDGQPGSPVDAAAPPDRSRSIPAQSRRAANSVNDDATLGSGGAMRASCPIRRNAIQPLPPMASWNQTTAYNLERISGQFS